MASTQKKSNRGRKGVPFILKAYRVPLKGHDETVKAIREILRKKRAQILKEHKAKK